MSGLCGKIQLRYFGTKRMENPRQQYAEFITVSHHDSRAVKWCVLVLIFRGWDGFVEKGI